MLLRVDREGSMLTKLKNAGFIRGLVPELGLNVCNMQMTLFCFLKLDKDVLSHAKFLLY